MPSVSLNTFLNFTAARGTARVAAATVPSGDYDPRKRASFEACRAGLSEWADGKRIFARRAPRLTWAAVGLEVRVNPELRLDVDGRPLVAKLHFKAAELDDARRDSILCLLAETAPPGVEAAILDARRGQLLTAEENDPDRDVLLISEAAAFVTLLGARGAESFSPRPSLTQPARQPLAV